MNKVYFIRHAIAENPKRLVGYDGVISAKGQLQLKQLTEFFIDKPVAVVFHSPLIRAQETALAVANNRIELLEADNRLRERQWGKDDATWEEFWEILNKMSLIERYKYKPPNGETWEEFEQRTADFWHNKIKDVSEDTVVVSHEGTMRCLLAYVLRDGLGGLESSLKWSIVQNFAFGSVSVLDKLTGQFSKEVFIPHIDENEPL